MAILEFEKSDYEVIVLDFITFVKKISLCKKKYRKYDTMVK
ncbi:hypothetical protein SSUST3_0164 [Streptococcus suis ST3]|nr:hypothetical protein SSUST3_0164 [Streptococcus suis ST3]AER16436.1 hypothetical protein SSUD9_0162 [Streptococcus suis D9]AGW86529.1 hypothetical protein YB51_0785 [Streptococcus suis YB51]